MAAFALTADTNIDALTGKAGGDTYTTDGFILTIDQDSRVGTNQSTSASLGSITVNATKGGKCIIDGTAVWMIPYTGGSGNVPAWNTAITQAGQSGSGKLIGVHSALTAASTATGSAMPASGYLRVKQKTGTYAAGALTGITATASNAGDVGWLEIVGDEAATVNANRLGEFKVLGAWFNVGTTNGSSNQTMQIPNNGLLRYAAGVFIETSAGSGTYEFWPNAGTTTTTGTEATRGKVVWIDANGLVRIGNSGAATNGYTPVTGLKVVVGNVFLENCTTAARTANVIPNATLATRYDFTCTGGGVVIMDKCNSAWYGSFAQPYAVTLTNAGFVDAINISECATALTWSNVGVGNKPTTALLVSPLTMSLCFAGGTLTDCVWARVSQAASGAHINTLTDISGFTFVRDTIRANTIRGNATTYSINGTRIVNCTWTNPVVIQGQMYFVQSSEINITNEIYCDAVSGTTVITYASYIWTLGSSCSNFMFSGLTFPVTNTHPYTALLNLAGAGSTVAGVSGIKMRNIGTYAAPLTLGSANACGLIALFGVAGAIADIKIQRVYTSNTRTGQLTSDNSTTRVTFENVFGDYADAADVANILGFYRKGIGGVPALTAQTSVYGTHWFDCHTSTTAGRLGILMNEASSLTTAQITLSGGSAFTSAGGLYMPTVGQITTFENPAYVIGHTGFQNSALVMAGGTATNYTYRYQINKNDGAGYSAWSASKTSTTLGTALNAETGIDAKKGLKLKLEITTGTTNTAAITSVYLLTTSTTTTQAYQYPLDPVTVKVTAKNAADASVVTGAHIFLIASSGGSLPAGAAVTSITLSGSVATVTHATHNVPDGTNVIISGATQTEYNGIKTISVVDANTYTYTVSGTPATPATGTIIATAVIMDTTTDGSGIAQDTGFAYSGSSQPFTGRARKGTATPFYRTSPISGSISSTGLDITTYMVKDE